MDELLNYISRCRNHPKRLGDQFYNFLHNLSEEARGRNNLVLVRLDPGLRAGDDARGPAGLRLDSRSCSTGSARR